MKIDLHFAKNEYNLYHQQQQIELSKSVIDTINVDVVRSFNSLKEISQDTLKNILKTYAVVNTSLDYCQGMNFIAGFLYLTLGKNEALAFAVMREVIEKYHIYNLFNEEQPMLKLMFYQLDRLISIHLPDLHSHFKNETINSSYFSSPYFVTLFTSILQTQPTFENSWMLQRVWDHFLIYGWKAIYKTCILVLKTFEEQLLNMSFEMMLAQLISLPVKFLYNDCTSLRDTLLRKREEAEDDKDLDPEQRRDIIREAEREFEDQKTQALRKLDGQLKAVKIPKILLERLKKEFDDSRNLSVQFGKQQ
mmetsp:Transcript_18683/g.31949  ORF Transcript_18683/g.31949 Transcript_18683/m.31949 type:complete len:306 (-) Transcript_18683:36-953(-)